MSYHKSGKGFKHSGNKRGWNLRKYTYNPKTKSFDGDIGRIKVRKTKPKKSK